MAITQIVAEAVNNATMRLGANVDFFWSYAGSLVRIRLTLSKMC